jgi:acyl-coenzyme A synthetase/AMP-(fatty) acid ligase/thioesterase domain-containing protein
VTLANASPELRNRSLAGTVRRVWTAKPHDLAISEASGRSVDGLGLLYRIDAWRDRLIEAGVTAGSTVGICLPRSIDQVAALFATHEIGAAYVPLDPNYPLARREYMVADLGVTVLLGSQNPEAPEFLGATWVDPPEWHGVLRRPQSTPKLHHAPSEYELAYVIYTSGSTGKPKGVRITHGNLNAFLHEWDGLVPPEPAGVWLGLTSLSFDPSVVELLWTLSRGWSIVLAPERPAPGAIGQLISTHKITHLQVTPTRASMLLSDKTDRKSLALLQEMFVGGEVLTATLARDLLRNVGVLTNVYGPTETTVWAFAHRFTAASTLVDPLPIGTPLQGVVARICPMPNENDAGTARTVTAEHNTSNEAMGSLSSGQKASESSREGTIGEIVLAGPDVSPGYHSSPTGAVLNSALSVSSTLSSAMPSTMSSTLSDSDGNVKEYRTGDLGRIGPDGLWYFHGRTDTQIKISGNRIEPAEIESVLLAQPGVALAAVVARVLVSGVPRLVAFVEPQPNSVTPLDPVSLQSACRTELPSIYVPAVVVIDGNLPKTPSGKVDRGALVVPAALADPGPIDEDADRLGKLCKVWALILGRPVAPDDDFFAFGGDSLGAVAVMAEVARVYGEQFGLAVLITAPTPRMLLAEIDRGQGYSETLVALRTVAEPKRRLFIVHGAGGNVVNIVHVAKTLPDDLDVYAFQAHGVATPDGIIDLTIETMAERYLNELRVLQPNGPYLLSGYSDGGLVAWEMARRLNGEGNLVRGLLLIDSALPPTPEMNNASTVEKLGNIFRNLRDRQRPGYVWLRDAAKGHRMKPTVSMVNASDLERLPNLDVQAEVERATDLYTMCALTIDVALVRAANTKPVVWVDFRWKRYVRGRFSVAIASGDHLGMVRPENAADLGNRITEALDFLGG